MPTDPKPPSLQDDDFFADRTFSDLSLEAADLGGKQLQGCTFRRCKLPESRWEKTKLEDCVFESCDLLRMVPRQLALRGVTFKDSRLMGVDWSDLAPMPDVRFEKCDLRYDSFVRLRLRATRFVGCLAREASFLETDLTEADFTDTDLQGSTIQGCQLARANFARASHVFFDPQKNRLKDTRLGLEAALAVVQSLGILVDELEAP
jgi:fluoroquinolone resistance protein